MRKNDPEKLPLYDSATHSYVFMRYHLPMDDVLHIAARVFVLFGFSYGLARSAELDGDDKLRRGRVFYLYLLGLSVGVIFALFEL